MGIVDEKIAFAEKHLTTKTGERFSAHGERQWVRDELFLPADGFKLWRRAGSDPCDDCMEHATEIVEHPNDNPTTSCKCGGLMAHPIIITLLNINRQEGKTTAAAGYTLATMFKSRNKSFVHVCASEGQAEELHQDNYEVSFKNSKALDKRAKTSRMSISVPKQKTSMRWITTSFKSSTGRSRTHIIIDEARDVPARVALSLIPSMFARHGVECPSGHVQLSPDESIDAPEKCSVCGKRLVPWYARLIIMSSAGIIDEEGGENDWMPEMLEELAKNPEPGIHVFQTQEVINPSKSSVITDTMKIFQKLDSTKHYANAELDGKWTKKGEPFIGSVELAAVVDSSLKNEDGCTQPCVGFLDTSITVDATSLVIMADSPDSEDLFEKIYQTQLVVWNPKDMGGVIDDREIVEYLDTLLPMYSDLREFNVDTRGMPWALSLVKELRHRGHRNVKAWTARKDESPRGWSAMYQRIVGGSIKFQDNAQQKREFKGAVWKRSPYSGQMEVADRDRKKNHRDITESDAMCCYSISKIILVNQGRGRRKRHDVREVLKRSKNLRSFSIGGMKINTGSF